MDLRAYISSNCPRVLWILSQVFESFLLSQLGFFAWTHPCSILFLLYALSAAVR